LPLFHWLPAIARKITPSRDIVHPWRASGCSVRRRLCYRWARNYTYPGSMLLLPKGSSPVPALLFTHATTRGMLGRCLQGRFHAKLGALHPSPVACSRFSLLRARRPRGRSGAIPPSWACAKCKAYMGGDVRITPCGGSVQPGKPIRISARAFSCVCEAASG